MRSFYQIHINNCDIHVQGIKIFCVAKIQEKKFNTYGVLLFDH